MTQENDEDLKQRFEFIKTFAREEAVKAFGEHSTQVLEQFIITVVTQQLVETFKK